MIAHFASALLVASPAPQSPPTETILATDDGVTFEIYPRSVRDAARGLLIAELMISLDTPLDDGFARSLQTWSFECDARTSQVVRTADYDADGNVIANSQDYPHTSRHRPVLAGSAAELALLRACAIAGKAVGPESSVAGGLPACRVQLQREWDEYTAFQARNADRIQAMRQADPGEPPALEDQAAFLELRTEIERRQNAINVQTRRCDALATGQD